MQELDLFSTASGLDMPYPWYIQDVVRTQEPDIVQPAILLKLTHKINAAVYLEFDNLILKHSHVLHSNGVKYNSGSHKIINGAKKFQLLSDVVDVIIS